MPVWLRVILVVGGLLLILVLGTAGIGWWWWTHHGRQALTQGIENGKASIKEGTEFARQSDQAGCVEAAFGRGKDCRNALACQLDRSLFVTGCLPEAKETPGFCDGVPETREIMASVKWRIAQCTARNAGNDQNCTQLYGAVQAYCDHPIRRDPQPAPVTADSAAR